jgi:hypothetical protein
MRIWRFIILLLALPSPGIPQATPDPVVIQGGTRVVLVNVVAKDKHGKPVADLTRDDFVLRDNGREEKIALFALEEVSQTATAAPGSASPVDVHQQARAGDRGGDCVPFR